MSHYRYVFVVIEQSFVYNEYVCIVLHRYNLLQQVLQG